MKRDGDVFAKPDVESDEERQARDRASRAEMCERLCGNADFREWMYAVLSEFCAFGFGRNPLDEFTQGVRACADLMQESLLTAPNAVAFLTELKRRSLEASREMLMKQHKEA